MAKILKPGEDSIRECVNALDEGLAIIYPTETVYGLGVDATSKAAIAHLLKIKQRDPSKPVSLAVASIEKAGEIAYLEGYARTLAERFLPGPLTLVLRAREEVPYLTVDGKIGIRIPANRFALDLLGQYSKPITATSANISGAGSVSDPSKIDKLLLGRVAIVIDAGKTEHKKESTVIDVSGASVKILREGAIKKKEIENVLKTKIT